MSCYSPFAGQKKDGKTLILDERVKTLAEGKGVGVGQLLQSKLCFSSSFLFCFDGWIWCCELWFGTDGLMIRLGCAERYGAVGEELEEREDCGEFGGCEIE